MKGKQFTRFCFNIPIGCDNTYYFLEICIAKVSTSEIENEGDLIQQEPQGALIAHLSTMSTSVQS